MIALITHTMRIYQRAHGLHKRFVIGAHRNAAQTTSKFEATARGRRENGTERERETDKQNRVDAPGTDVADQNRRSAVRLCGKQQCKTDGTSTLNEHALTEGQPCAIGGVDADIERLQQCTL